MGHEKLIIFNEWLCLLLADWDEVGVGHMLQRKKLVNS